MAGLSMQPQVEVLSPPQLPETPSIACYRCRVQDFALDDLIFIDVDEVSSFATDKRRMEHLSGRWLLEYALIQWGIKSVDEIEVRRNELRAPSLAFINGVWRNEALPSISIGHGNGWAYVAVIESNWTIGIDAEPRNRGIADNALDLMASGDELQYIRQNPHKAIRFWTAKESVQKAMRMGMKLNPREIKVPIGKQMCDISIEKSILQLRNWVHEEVHISLSWMIGEGQIRSAEDDLLDATREAMNSGQEWQVGCNTTRKNC
ncbi:MAG TPA: 4'-phosphopantetheinyl transferase superfamily protein [Candidatus Poseidoniales archaeon]|nr:4'-phosphopantetheinyl transferase superfamily protein [Candidatus Poseidoniales archaeon]